MHTRVPPATPRGLPARTVDVICQPSMSRCQRRIVSGVISSRSPWRPGHSVTIKKGRGICVSEGPCGSIEMVPQET